MDLGALVTQMRNGNGLLGRLVTDEELGESVGDNLEELLENLRQLSTRNWKKATARWPC